MKLPQLNNQLKRIGVPGRKNWNVKSLKETMANLHDMVTEYQRSYHVAMYMLMDFYRTATNGKFDIYHRKGANSPRQN